MKEKRKGTGIGFLVKEFLKNILLGLSGIGVIAFIITLLDNK